MARTALCETGEWHLADEDQDIRGWPLYDISGDRLGTITELIIDTRLKRIDAIVLDNGKEYPASDIELGDEAAHLQADTGASDAGTGTAGRSRTAPGGAGLSAQQPGTTTGFVDYEGTFRQHYKSTYGSSTGDYDDRYEPAYRHGYTYGSNPEYRHREFSTAEPELRRHYEAEHGEGTFEQVRDAVEHAYNQVRQHGAAAAGGTPAGTAASETVGAGEQDELFRRHYRQTYSGQRAEEFDRFKPAYQFGYRHGSLKELRDEPYMQVEPVLRRRYEEEHGEGSFDDVKEAVGYGYRLANATGSHPSGRDAK